MSQGTHALEGSALAAYEAFAPFYDEAVAGADLPLLRRGGKLSGPKPADGVSGATVSRHRIELSFGCSDETGDAGRRA